MRENRPYGSEGGESSALPDPYPRLCRARNRRLPLPEPTAPHRVIAPGQFAAAPVPSGASA
jgi:hypothetical protein